MADDRLYLRQLLSGRDFGARDPVAAQMLNFVYFVGDRKSGECLVVDPAYDVQGILDVAEADGMRVTGILGTHFHPDHIGGDLFGHEIEGVRELLEIEGMKLHVQREEKPWVKEVTEVSDSDLSLHDSGDELVVGEVRVELIHTPGHTPGSQCFLVENRLVAGDTLFLTGCGRTDLPGGDMKLLYRSIHDKLAKVPDDAVLLPGHRYDPRDTASMGETRAQNFVFKPQNEAEWLALFAGF